MRDVYDATIKTGTGTSISFLPLDGPTRSVTITELSIYRSGCSKNC
jgi:hypothetical protein